MRLVVLREGAMVADVVCGEEAVYVGTADDCRVRIDDPRVAPRQLVIFPEGQGAWSVQQLAPECAVQLNQNSLADKSALNTGDELVLAEYAVRVYPEHADQPGGRVELGTSRAALERFAASRLPPGTLIKKTDEAVTVPAAYLGRVGEATLALSQCVQVEQVMDVALRSLLVTFVAHRVWVGVRRVNYGPMEYVEGRLLTGSATDLPEVAGVLKPRVLDRAQFMLVPIFSSDEPMSILSGPLVGPDGTLGMLYMDTGNTGRRFDTPEMDLFVVLSHVIAAQLDAIFKIAARNRTAMLEGEVTVAHAIQNRLTPRKLPQWPGLQWGAFREAGVQHTGDIYDVVKLSNGHAAFVLAHTPSTGPMPSLLMAQVQTAFRFAAMHQDQPHVVLRSLNWLLYDGEKDHPLDCVVGMIDPETGELRYSIAGTTGAYIIGARGEERPLLPDTPTPSLGMTKSASYPLLPEQLEPSETMVVYSPGVTTAKNRDEETFGEERFINILCDGFGQLASAMMKEMLTDLRNFTEGGSQPDDITVLMAHRVA